MNVVANPGSGQLKSNRPAGQKEQVQPASDLDRIKEDAEALANSVGSAAGHQYERAQDVAKDTRQRSEGAIRRNPFSAIVASLGLGFLLGLFRSGRK
jgi:ElaB/YqjD/DUF883 family membrane-anchored ribosome-binding protein